MSDSFAIFRSLPLRSVLDWLYPPRCRFCKERIFGEDQECFCAACRKKIRLVSHPLCVRCGRPFLDTGGEDHLCGPCILRAPYYHRARAWACYPREESEDPLREVLQRFKYGRKVSLGKPLGHLMAKGCFDYWRDISFDAIIPVPLHRKRLRWRGFNQAVLLAREASRLWRVPMDPFVLSRTKETPPQTQLPEAERRKNVRGAFSLNPEKPVERKVLLVVDDVYTTGATVNECSRVLIRAGAEEVHVLTLARTVS